MECIISVWLDATHIDGYLVSPDATGGWAVSVDAIDHSRDDIETDCEIVRTFPEDSLADAIELAILIAMDTGRRVLWTDSHGERSCVYDPESYRGN